LFDLSTITNLTSKKIDRAILTYRVKQSEIKDEKGDSPAFATLYSCARKLYTAADTWKEGLQEKDAPFPTDRLVSSLPETGASGPTISVDVSRQVADWVLKPKTNHGFVFVGPLEDTAPGNHRCVSRLGDFTLTIEYTAWMSP
jgi:hypothetical protein